MLRQCVRFASSTAPTRLMSSYASSCTIPESFEALPLLRKSKYSHNATLLTFETPRKTALSLPVCSCILLKTDSEAAIRPYTPVSQETDGEFDLLVKEYPDGVASQFLAKLKVGETAEFKHIIFNVKIPYPFKKKSITMIAGGTGITPMYQALELLANTPGDDTEVTLLYGNASTEDILMQKELERLEKVADGRLKVVHVLGTAQDQPPIKGWGGELGWIDLQKVKTYAFPPSEDTMVFVCGLPALYTSMCGPRDEQELAAGSVLHQLGYSDDQVYKF